MSTRTAAARRIALIYAAAAGSWIALSDVLLGLVTGEFGAVTLGSLGKGLLFVAVTSVLLYFLVVRIPGGAGAGPFKSESTAAGSGRLSRAPSFIFGALAVLLVAGFSALEWRHAVSSLENEQDDVAAIGELKAGQIELWLSQQARSLASYRLARGLREDIGALATRPDERIAAELRLRLGDIRDALGAESMTVLDTHGEILVSSGEPIKLSSWLRGHVDQALLSDALQANLLHRDAEDGGGEIHLDYLLPLRSTAGEKAVIGILVLRHNPQAFLFPHLQSWPARSPSAEALLVRREGDNIVFLNELRHRKNTALRFRLPMTGDSPAVKVVQGGTGLVRGVDYRGEEVLAFGRPVAGTDWFLVSKVDAAEVLADARLRALLSVVLILALTLFASIGATFLWRRRDQLASRRHEALQVERDALDGHLRMLSQHANDIILLLDESGRILNANERAFEAYGRKSGGLIGLPAADLRAPDTTDGFIRGFQAVLTEGNAIYETVHLGAGGREFPVEVSARRIDVDGRQFVQAIIRDISERKKTENALRESEQRFRAVLEQSIAGIYVIQDGRIVYINPRMREIFGYGPDDRVEPDPLAFVAPSDRAKVVEQMTLRLTDEPTAAYSVGALRKDGSPFTLGVHARRASYDGRPAIIAVAQDITEKAKAEQEIKRYVARLEQAMRSTIEVVSTIGELRDPYTHGHEHRVGEIAAAIGAEMGLGADRVEGIRVAGYLHDVGKIAVPAEILAKPARLTPPEFELVKGHAQQSYEILKGVEFPWPVAVAAWQHHERLDGSGYPRGLKGDEIILEGRVLAVADTVEAMASHRPYRPGLGIERALAEIEDKRGRLFDAQAVDACLRLFREKGYQLPA